MFIMGGLAGLIGVKEKDSQKIVESMLDKIIYRGSRKKKVISAGNGILGFITNSKDKKLISDNSGETVLLDGKIYNLDDLVLKYTGIKKEKLPTDEVYTSSES